MSIPMQTNQRASEEELTRARPQLSDPRLGTVQYMPKGYQLAASGTLPNGDLLILIEPTTTDRQETRGCYNGNAKIYIGDAKELQSLPVRLYEEPGPRSSAHTYHTDYGFLNIGQLNEESLGLQGTGAFWESSYNGEKVPLSFVRYDRQVPEVQIREADFAALAVGDSVYLQLKDTAPVEGQRLYGLGTIISKETPGSAVVRMTKVEEGPPEVLDTDIEINKYKLFGGNTMYRSL